ncbi:sensor histidine kinase [Acidipila sp. EB88]|uniref:sensor histidine kinase n=1 Tax=Acidipila sp. EB88 TaxID=2305226 RepID=UPI000F5F56CE|nr:sensor histidine kinase [Acidipila sp. EB88]
MIAADSRLPRRNPVVGSLWFGHLEQLTCHKVVDDGQALKQLARGLRCRLVACGLLLFASGPLLHARDRPMPFYFHHQAWSTEDGLPQASVHALLQSGDGSLWVGTEAGLARFDGQSFRVLNHDGVPALASDDISSLAEDAAGDLWFGTVDGLVRKRGEAYRLFRTQDGLPSNEIVSVASRARELLVLTTGGLAAERGDHFEWVRTSARIVSVSNAADGLVAVDSRGTPYRWRSGRLVAQQAPQPEALPVLGAVVNDRRQEVWTYGSDFVHVVSPSQTRTWHTGTELPGSRVQALYADGQGRMWIGTNRGLVSAAPAAGFRFEPWDALRGESVLSIDQDREGDLWIGTEGSGLHALQPRKFAMDLGSGSETITAIVRNSSGRMDWGTRDDGVFQSGTTAVALARGRLLSPVVLSLAAGRQGDVWVGTPDGLNHIAGAKVQRWTVSEGLPDDFVRSVLVDADDTVWAGTRFGLAHIDKNTVHTFTLADGLGSNSIGPMLGLPAGTGTGGVLYVGTSNGLCVRSGRAFRCVSSGAQQGGSIITALGADHQGRVWAAVHEAGLALAGENALLPVHSAALPREILGILADQDGYLWLRSTRGLYRTRVNELRACLAGTLDGRNLQVDAYGRSDGMPSEEAVGAGSPTVAEGEDGELWFATRRGIAVTDPEHLRGVHVPPGIVLTQVFVDGASFAMDAPAEIGPGHQQFSFEYAGLSLNNAARIHYRYQLNGFDQHWVDAGTRRTAYYTNLPPGQYAFHVIAANGDGVWSRDEAVLRFRVRAPWYRKLWVYLLAGCVAIVGVLGLVQVRLRAEARRFALVLQERTRVAREMHDTLAQDLVSVSLQVEIATQHAKAGRLSDVLEPLAQTRSLVRQALESARQSIWNLRVHLSDASLPARLTARVKSFQDAATVTQLRIGGEYRSAAPEVENEVMRIASEAISNVEQHAGATEMLVSLEYGSQNLRLRVRDNGCGFHYAASRALPGHYGIRGLEERAAELRAELQVESALGHGTTVTLTVPLPEEDA